MQMEGRAVGVPISEGSLGDGSSETGPRLLLIKGDDTAEAPGDECTVTVTWNGAKYRQGYVGKQGDLRRLDPE